MQDKKFSPILPYDASQFDSFYIYDHVTYVRDINLAPNDSIGLHSDNMIKYFRCEDLEPVPIGGD